VSNNYPFLYIKEENMKKNNKITIYEYLAINVPDESHKAINTLGNYKRAKDGYELIGQLKHFVRSHKEDGLKVLSEIHPDKELIELSCNSCKKLQEKNNNFSNLVEESKKPKEKDNSKINQENLSFSKMAVFGGFLLIALALITKKN
jgi:hypothetical protein|tara:strand:+ start:6681 stop:7121 length:441 start_codon:yes stop_codon:yes gene_type:complete